MQAASKEDLKGMVPDKKGKKPPTARAAAAAATKAAKAEKAAAKASAAGAKAAREKPREDNEEEEEDDDSKAGTPSGSQRGIKGSTQQWTLHEDNQLRRLVDEFGHRKWSFIASRMLGRRGKQCRDRWLNHLKPDIRRGEWTTEEERILVEGHRMLGTRWAALAKLLPGRPENAIKNHWHATLRCKWAQRGGRISELQAYQHSLHLTNGGGGPVTAAQKAAAVSSGAASPFPTAAASAAAVAAAAAAAVTKSKGTPGSSFEFDGAAAAAAVAAAAAAVVGRGGESGSGSTQGAIARALDGIVGGGAAKSAASPAPEHAGMGKTGAGEGEEAAVAAMLGGMADALSPGSAAAAGDKERAHAPETAPADVVRGPRAAEADALAGEGPTNVLGATDVLAGDGDAVSATAAPLPDLDALSRAMGPGPASDANANASSGSHPGVSCELCVLTSFADKKPGADGPPLGESLAAHGALVESALRRVAESARKKYAVARVALLLRLGAVPAGAPAVVVAVSAARWRDAADAAAHCSGEIKDKLAASLAPLCLGSEPKAAAALAAVAAAAGTTTASLLGQTIGDLAVEAMVKAMTASDREKIIAAANESAVGRERSAREMEVAERTAEAAATADEPSSPSPAAALAAGGGERLARPPAIEAERASLAPQGDEGNAMDVDRIAEPKGLATPDAETAAEKA